MTTQELFEMLLTDLKAFRAENKEDHFCILEKIERIRQENSSQDLAIHGVEIDARNTSKSLNEHKRRHWGILLLLFSTTVAAIFSLVLQLITRGN